MSLALYSTPSSQATPRPPRLFKTRRNGRAWTMAVRAIRVVITTGREFAPSQAPSAEQLADIVIDNISRLELTEPDGLGDRVRRACPHVEQIDQPCRRSHPAGGGAFYETTHHDWGPC